MKEIITFLFFAILFSASCSTATMKKVGTIENERMNVCTAAGYVAIHNERDLAELIYYMTYQKICCPNGIATWRQPGDIKYYKSDHLFCIDISVSEVKCDLVNCQ